MKRRSILIAAACAASLALPWSAGAQPAYPSKPITWVVGFPPGGGADFVARAVTRHVAPAIGQPIVVENRPGASSIIAAQYVAQAAPDGYTVLGAENGALVFNAALYSKLPYDPRDFVPVSNIIRAPLVLVVHPGFPAADFKSFLEQAKKQAGKLNYASPGRGIAHHLAMETLKVRAGINVVRHRLQRPRPGGAGRARGPGADQRARHGGRAAAHQGGQAQGAGDLLERRASRSFPRCLRSPSSACPTWTSRPPSAWWRPRARRRRRWPGSAPRSSRRCRPRRSTRR